MSGFALFAERRYTWAGHPFGPREIGFGFAYVGLLGIILQGGLIGRLVKWYGEARLVSVGFLALIVGYFGLGASYSIVPLLLSSTLLAFGMGVLRPAISGIITQHAERHEQGVVAGLTSSLMSMGSIVAPVVAGLCIQHGQLTLWAWLAGTLALVGALLGRGADAAQPSV
jgi:MFS family permease